MISDLARPLRQTAGVARLFVDLERAEEERHAGDNHDDRERQQEERVTDDVDACRAPSSGSMLFTMSMRMCSLSSSVHGEHSRNTTLNNIHCSSSQEFDEVSNTLRTVALAADTTTATRISHESQRPSRALNASMVPLTLSSALRSASKSGPLRAAGQSRSRCCIPPCQPADSTQANRPS